jgi:hypothetical protein
VNAKNKKTIAVEKKNILQPIAAEINIMPHKFYLDLASSK